jgi:hypothetical protein
MQGPSPAWRILEIPRGSAEISNTNHVEQASLKEIKSALYFLQDIRQCKSEIVSNVNEKIHPKNQATTLHASHDTEEEEPTTRARGVEQTITPACLAEIEVAKHASIMEDKPNPQIQQRNTPKNETISVRQEMPSKQEEIKDISEIGTVPSRHMPSVGQKEVFGYDRNPPTMETRCQKTVPMSASMRMFGHTDIAVRILSLLSSRDLCRMAVACKVLGIQRYSCILLKCCSDKCCYAMCTVTLHAV